MGGVGTAPAERFITLIANPCGHGPRVGPVMLSVTCPDKGPPDRLATGKSCGTITANPGFGLKGALEFHRRTYTGWISGHAKRPGWQGELIP